MSPTLSAQTIPVRASFAAFAPEWAALGLFVLAAMLASLAAGLSFSLVPRDGFFLLFLLGSGLGLRRFGLTRAGAFLEYFSLILIAYVTVSVFTYAAMAASSPLADAPLAAMDRALGFDWMAWLRFVTGHQTIAHVLRFLYFTIGYQTVYFIVLMLAMNRLARLSEIFWLLLVAGSITALGAWAWPALGPFHQYGMDAQTPFLGEMANLHARHDLHFPLEALQGVVSFPSFHTTLALAFAYGFRGTGPIGWIIGAANAILLLGVPVYGGHYVIDMIAGAGVLVASAALVHAVPRWRAKAAAG